jgi:hypothetical protein
MRNYRRKAKAVFYIVFVAVTILAACILSSMWQPVLALIVGALIGLVLASIAFSVVAAWPVIRVIWWWLPELSVTGGLITGWFELASHTDLIARLVSVTAIVGIPAAFPPLRRRLSALAWCQVSRHRIRTCFNEFIVTNRTGSLPLVLGAHPTPAGERLWVFLRPGLSLEEIQQRADKLAAGCWAHTVIADRASNSNAALVRIDIKRRDPLTGTIASPFKAMISGHGPGARPAVPVPDAVNLDLTDVQAADVLVTPVKNGTVVKNGNPPKWPNPPASNGTTPASPAADENLADWI